MVAGPTSAGPGKDRLRLWIRLLRASRTIEAELRERLKTEFNTTLPRFDVMAALYRSPEGSDCAGCVAAGFELHAQVILRLWIFGIDFDGFAELGEGTRVIALTA